MDTDLVRSRPVLLAVPAVLTLGVAVVVLLAVHSSGSDGPAGAAATGFDRSAWPGPDSTGVPAGTELTPYTGPCVITEPGTEIDAKEVACDLVVRAPGVHITNSTTRRIEIGDPPASVVVEDTSIDAGAWVGGAVAFGSMTLRRVDVRGGQHSVQCSGTCVVEDSWLHAQSLPPDEPRHLNAFISNGGSDMVLRHNALSCDRRANAVDGGCTADLSLFGDFGPVTDVTVEDNLFLAGRGGYCGSFGDNPEKKYGEASTGIVVVDNVFERGPTGTCGTYGAATSFRSDGEGNRWADNTWDDGSVLTP
ncbi:hypothetical protein [Nocardioides sp. LS1]|uniref:hypothetical protein n=1 Tax=Nocardioides sp. LS1 TaxID=1027620 RepID=UPI000F616FD0|nr:hypothetical protein [Nocardioides sp. LS1]GCD91323.1 hypothetical protein NLS1_33290 [Nocardioides sp. LS1]